MSWTPSFYCTQTLFWCDRMDEISKNMRNHSMHFLPPTQLHSSPFSLHLAHRDRKARNLYSKILQSQHLNRCPLAAHPPIQPRTYLNKCSNLVNSNSSKFWDYYFTYPMKLDFSCGFWNKQWARPGVFGLTQLSFSLQACCIAILNWAPSLFQEILHHVAPAIYTLYLNSIVLCSYSPNSTLRHPNWPNFLLVAPCVTMLLSNTWYSGFY